MSNEIDVSDPDSLQGPGHTDAWRVLRLILAQAVADSSSAVVFQHTDDGATLRYETRGYWCEMVAPPPAVMGPLLGILKEKAGLDPQAHWGEGDIRLRTKKGSMIFHLSTCTDPQGRGLVILCRAPMRDARVPN